MVWFQELSRRCMCIGSGLCCGIARGTVVTPRGCGGDADPSRQDLQLRQKKIERKYCVRGAFTKCLLKSVSPGIQPLKYLN